ncbi:MAG: type II toxin-antitoxin system HicA family toxin [Oscillospiraceae bacterium]|nr:type II toxin-antitoxin system HicA family toxin [Oscillospiraceae bacterium]
MNKDKLLQKVIANQHNVKYNDFVVLIESFGFAKKRTNGSHSIFRHSDISEIINIQNVKGEAKPYQIKQFLAIVEKYDLRMEG